MSVNYECPLIQGFVNQKVDVSNVFFPTVRRTTKANTAQPAGK